MSEIKWYLQSCRSEFWQKIFRAELEYVLQHLAGSEKVLSVGCGPAVIESALSARGFGVTGLDVSPEALDRTPDNVRTVVARAEDMPFPDSSFDAVIYVASLQFIADYKKALAETTRVLRPRGLLLALLLNPQSGFFRRKFRDPGSYVRKIRHTNLREIEETITEKYSAQAEYYLGVTGDDRLFSTQEPTSAALYIIKGIKKGEECIAKKRTEKLQLEAQEPGGEEAQHSREQ